VLSTGLQQLNLSLKPLRQIFFSIIAQIENLCFEHFGIIASALSILKMRVPSIGPISETGENQGGFPWEKVYGSPDR
jgi:hypothetical protein